MKALRVFLWSQFSVVLLLLTTLARAEEPNPPAPKEKHPLSLIADSLIQRRQDPSSTDKVGRQDEAKSAGSAVEPARSAPPEEPPKTNTASSSSQSDKYRKATASILQLRANALDPAIDANSLFPVDLGAEEEVLVEVRRLQALLLNTQVPPTPEAEQAQEKTGSKKLPNASLKQQPAKASVDKEPQQAEPKEVSEEEAAKNQALEDLWETRVALDRARLEFLELPLEERKALLDEHALRVKKQQEEQGDSRLAQAAAESESASQKREVALQEARDAKSEAERRVSEEYARLLDVSRRQADFESSLLKVGEATAARKEALLTWRRRIAVALKKEQGTFAIDQLYDELVAELRKTRRDFSKKLSEVSTSKSDVPLAGEDVLEGLPDGVDRERVTRERAKTMRKANELMQTEVQLRRASAKGMMAELEGLNHLRLSLIDALTPTKRSSLFALNRNGWNQATSELNQVVLSLRYRSFASQQWLRDWRESESSRTESVWTAAWLFARWIIPLGVFIWWRRRADDVLISLRKRLAQERRKYRRRAPDADKEERAISFLLRVRRPLEWLVLIHVGLWLLPTAADGQSKAGVVVTALTWIYSGQLIVSVLDALSSSEIRGFHGNARGTENSQLRLRSLRLVGRSVVAFGLVLSLSAGFVGEGTLYSWVLFSYWFTSLPILLLIISWWRPVIFERFALFRKKKPFEAWVLKNSEGTVSFLAAVSGGIYLFSHGMWRFVRSWVVTFSITRRVLAYLFRRDVERHAKSNSGPKYEPISQEYLELLSPNRPCEDYIESSTDAALKEVIRKINQPGGGIFAVVGERGLGKTTLLAQIAAAVPDITSIVCPRGGVENFGQALNQELRLSHSTSIESSAMELNERVVDAALLVDDAQHLIQPFIGGLDDLDAVLDLARTHSTNCAWVFSFDAVIWRFLERARGARPLFDDIIYLKPWSEESIVDLLIGRNKKASISPGFDDLLTDLSPDADEIDRLEALQRTEGNYYRLLWDYAAGNPAVALHFWSNSLGIDDKQQNKVRLFDAPSAEDLETLPDSAIFVLRAIIQLGHAQVPEICRATSLPERQVRDALRYGSVRGYFEIEEERYHITWEWFRAITRFLSRRHLIFSGAGS